MCFCQQWLLLATLPYLHIDLWSPWLPVVLWTDSLSELWISAAPSERPWKLLWAVLSVLGLCLGRFAVVGNFFYFWMMDWTVLREMFKAQDISYNLTQLHLWASLMFSNKPVRPSQSSCVYNETKSHTGGLCADCTGCYVSEFRGWIQTHFTFVFGDHVSSSYHFTVTCYFLTKYVKVHGV